jgi:hypothetical protein
MCTVLLPQGVNIIAVNKYIVSKQIPDFIYENLRTVDLPLTAEFKTSTELQWGADYLVKG